MEAAEKEEDLYGTFDDVSELQKGYKSMRACYINQIGCFIAK